MEDNRCKYWGLVNVFTNPNDINLHKGSFSIHNNKYSSFYSLTKGSIFELKKK